MNHSCRNPVNFGFSVRLHPQSRSAHVAIAVCFWMLVDPTTVSGQPSSRNVTVATLDGRRLQGRLESLSNGRLKLAGSEPVPVADLLIVMWPGQPVEKFPRDARVLFANGDIVLATPTALDGESLTAHWTQFNAWPEVHIPLETLRGSLLVPPDQADARLKLFTRISLPADKSDLVYLKNGDSLAGELTSLADGKLSIKGGTNTTVLPFSALLAFSFNPELTSIRKFSGAGVIVFLTDGSRLHAKNLRTTNTNSILADAAFGAELEIPLTAVHSLQMLGGSITYLSDLQPAHEKSEGFLGSGWTMRKDRNVSGGPLQVRGVEYATGLGVHSRSELTWKLDGKFRRFQATVGIDDSSQGKGSVVFRVLVDGKSAFTSKPVTGIQEPLAIPPVDLTRAKSLTLIVDFGADADILDHADWCNACLIR